MLSEKPWRPELILRFFAVCLVCYSLGTLIVAMLTSKHSPVLSAADYIILIGGTVSFHGVVLAQLPRLLREHGMSCAEAFGIGRTAAGRAVSVGAAAGLVSVPVILVTGAFSSAVLQWLGFSTELQASVQMLQRNASPGFQAISFLMAVVIAPAAEEIAFRGILYPSILQLGFPRFALWGSSILFGAIHANLLTLLPLVVLSVFLTLLYRRTGNLASSIAMHAMFNLVNFAKLAFFPDL